MASPAHRENMLTPEWREVGIGSLRARSAGGIFAGEATWVITMDFGARSGKVVNRQLSRPQASTEEVEHAGGCEAHEEARHETEADRSRAPATSLPSGRR